MSSSYEVTRLDDLDRIPVGNSGLEWRPIRRRFDLGAFGINAYSSAHVGGEIVEDHTEEQLGHQEVYLVVRGRATFHLDGNDVDAPAGTLVVLKDPSVKRGATADFDETIDKMLASARKFDPAKIRADQVAQAAGPPEEQ